VVPSVSLSVLHSRPYSPSSAFSYHVTVFRPLLSFQEAAWVIVFEAWWTNPSPFPTIHLTLLVWEPAGSQKPPLGCVAASTSESSPCTLPAAKKAATVRVERMNFMVVWSEVVL